MTLASCSLCGDEIYEKDIPFMYRQIVGWERTKRRKGGGTNMLRIRRETGALAHNDCIEKGVRRQKQGLPLDHQTLF